MKEQRPSFRRILQPYLFISLAGLLAFAPVSFMLKALKNDIVALEYPINHFISQCIHNGELPYWFNTWGMGFPLQSNLTWGIFSTPQMLFSSLFNYNMYILHIEFMFFVLLAGWSMFHLLHKYFVKDEWIAQLLAVCYMLSGFMVGSTQWLLYITAASFIPLVISSLLALLYTPSFKNAFQFSVVYFLMFTSVYAAFNIITTYSLLLFILFWFLMPKNEKGSNRITFRYTLLAGVFTVLLCFPCLYYTVEVLKYIGRGEAIATDTTFFNSNYLHPSALSNMLLPFSSVKMSFPNTEGTMLNSYTGLFVLLLFPAAIWQAVKEKSRPALLILSAAIIFLLFSFGEITPLRNALNLLPGFSYFRNPAIFRLYFIISIILFIAILFRNKSFNELFTFKPNHQANIIRYTLRTLIVVCLLTFLLHIKQVNNLSFSSLTAFIKNISPAQAILISSFIQLIILVVLLLAAKMKKNGLIFFLLTADLIINTLVCTPFFSVSSYSIPAVNQILQSNPGFPVQHKTLDAVPTTYRDEKGNTWNNINVFSKQVSSNEAYRGPLTLKTFYLQGADSSQRKKMFEKKLVFADDDSASASIQLLIQKPAHIQASVNLTAPGTITVMQNYYPGWKAWYNNKIQFVSSDKPGMTIAVPKGEGRIDFRYERKGIWVSALLLHLITLCFLLWKGIHLVKRLVNRLPFHSSTDSMVH